MPVTLTASASSGLPVSFSSGTPAVCSVSGATVTTLTPGTCSITATQGGSTTYAAARETRSLAVQAGHRAQWISFGIPPAARVGQPVVLTASASSGLPVSFWSGTPAVCSVSGATVTTLTPGTCSIAATQGGSTLYAAARAGRMVIPGEPGGAGHIPRDARPAGRRGSRRRGRRPGPAPAVAAAAAARPPGGAGPSVRAAANPGPPGSARSRTTGAAAAHTVRINAHPGASTTMIKGSPMTPALQAHPETVLDLLFDPGGDSAQALGREILSAGGSGELGHALADLPAVTREAAVREVSQAAAGLLDIDLLGLLVAGWRGSMTWPARRGAPWPHRAEPNWWTWAAIRSP